MRHTTLYSAVFGHNGTKSAVNQSVSAHDACDCKTQLKAANKSYRCFTEMTYVLSVVCGLWCVINSLTYRHVHPDTWLVMSFYFHGLARILDYSRACNLFGLCWSLLCKLSSFVIKFFDRGPLVPLLSHHSWWSEWRVSCAVPLPTALELFDWLPTADEIAEWHLQR